MEIVFPVSSFVIGWLQETGAYFSNASRRLMFVIPAEQENLTLLPDCERVRLHSVTVGVSMATASKPHDGLLTGDLFHACVSLHWTSPPVRHQDHFYGKEKKCFI